MDLFTFIASLMKALAWPVVVLVVAVIFRKAIANRIGSIRKISHKDTAVEFDHEAREVKAAIAVERVPAPIRDAIEDKTRLSTNINRIVQAWSGLEGIVRKRLADAGAEGPYFPHAALIAAADRGLISSEQLRSLKGLNTMRNLAVHGNAKEIDDVRTEEFLILAEAMKTVLEITDPKPRS